MRRSAQYQKAIEIHPDFARARYDLATALLQKGRVDEAIGQYQKVLEIHPHPDKTHNILGNELLQKTLELRVQPDVAEVHDNLGSALLQKGRVDEAIIQCQMALEIRPDDAEAQINLGIAFFKKGRVDEAIARFQKAMEISPGNPKACHNLTHMAWVLATCPDASIRNGAKAIRWFNKSNSFPRAEILWSSRRWRRLMPRRGDFRSHRRGRTGTAVRRFNKAMPHWQMFWAGRSSCINRHTVPRHQHASRPRFSSSP